MKQWCALYVFLYSYGWEGSSANLGVCATQCPTTVARDTMALLDQYDVEVMEWPAINPDMNPIEHVWDQISIWIRDMDLPHSNLVELRQLIEAEWCIYASVNLPSLVPKMACRLDGAKPLSKYWNYYLKIWNIVNWNPGNKLQWNFSQNSNIFIQENTFENVVCEMASICLGLNKLSCPQSMVSTSCGKFEDTG